MRIRGVTYDVGSVMGGNWRPDYDPKVVRRELEIIKNDLHCNAARISGRDIDRLAKTAEDALQIGLEVWLAPLLWDKSPEQTLDYTVNAAKAAEYLRKIYPDRIVLSVGSELTLFMRGIVEGKTLMARIHNAFDGEFVKSGKHNKALNDYLAKASTRVREVFQGKITYCSLIAERVDWRVFDFVGVDHYWSERIKDRYLDLLRPLYEFGKPVVVTEFGFGATTAPVVGGALAFGNVDQRSRFLHLLPLVGRFVKPRLAKIYPRDEGMQATRLLEQLKLLDSINIDGAFISTFVFPLNPYDDEPKYDLDIESASLVKFYEGGRHGTTYPEMRWEPKEAFRAVAGYYGKSQPGPSPTTAGVADGR